MLKINELARLHLGVKGENLSRTIEIDMSAWAQIYPNATAEILHKRYGDQTKELTGATYDSDRMVLSWTPTEYDTYYEGYGTAEIRMVAGDVVKKTKDLIVTAVCPSVIDGSGQVVASDYQAFLDSVIGYKNGAYTAKVAAETAQEKAEDAKEDAEAAADDAEDAADRAEDATVHGPVIDDVSGNWLVWDWDAGEYTDTGIHAQGPQGEPGTIDNVRATGIKMSITDDTTVYDAIGAKAGKVSGATTNNFAALDASGNLKDSGSKASDFLTSHQDITGKADKVSSPTENNFAALDASGNLKDSGHKHSDYLTSHQDITGKADKVSSATEDNFAALDANGNLKDSGHKHSDYLTSHQDITGKADKVESATSGNFAGLDANGNLTDSGSKAGDFLTSHQDISGKANADAIAIVSDGNTHAAITAGQYVYIKNHSTLADGLYTAGSNIAQDGALTSSNVAAVSGGGMNALSDQIGTLNTNKINTSDIKNNVTTTSSGYVLDARQGKALNDKLTTTDYSSDLAVGQSGTSLSDAYLKKVNNVITMSCVLKNSSTSAQKTISAYEPLVTFPSSIGRPSQHIQLCARASDNSVKDLYVSKYAVSGDSTKGQVVFADALTLPASGWIKFNVTWIV